MEEIAPKRWKSDVNNYISIICWEKSLSKMVRIDMYVV